MQTFRNGSYCHVNHLRLLFLTISGIFLTRTSSPFPALWVCKLSQFYHVHLHAVLECKPLCLSVTCSVAVWDCDTIILEESLMVSLWIFNGMTKEIVFFLIDEFFVWMLKEKYSVPWKKKKHEHNVPFYCIVFTGCSHEQTYLYSVECIFVF